VIYEGSIHVGSSLLFYLDRKFYLVNQNPAAELGGALGRQEQMFLDQRTVVDVWNGPDRVYLVVEENRVPHWQQLLHKSGDAAKELTSCGTVALLGNDR
jgi:hypothetical protein